MMELVRSFIALKEWQSIRLRAQMERNNQDKLCVYCGDWYQCLDHYIPVNWTEKPRSRRAADVVPCCVECNSILGGRPLFGLRDRARYLVLAYTKRLAPYNRIPEWTERELSELEYNLRTMIRSAMIARDIYEAKLVNLRYVARLCSS
jgi:hypothetical protein